MCHGLCEGDEGQASALNCLEGRQMLSYSKLILSLKHTFNYSNKSHFICVLVPSDLVEFVLQQTGIQAELSEAVLLHRLNDTVHLSVALGGQVREVDVMRDELSAQHTRVKETKDLLCIAARTTKVDAESFCRNSCQGDRDQVVFVTG